MSSLYSRILILAVLYMPTLSTKKSRLRVLGGVDDTMPNYPYVVALKESLLEPRSVCTGSLISATWVLSAAHCFVRNVAFIQYGDMSLTLPFTQSKSVVLKIILHPSYIKLQHNDIALILVAPVNLQKYGSLSAVDYRTLLGVSVEFAGFGRTFLLSKNLTNVIKHGLFDVFRPLQIGESVVTSCGEIFRKSYICLASKCMNKQSVLGGDSGGPLIYDQKIIGVAHAILTNIEEDLPPMYQAFLPVSPFLTWIRSVILTRNN